MSSALRGLACGSSGSLMLCGDPAHCSEFRAQFAHKRLLVFIISIQLSPGIPAASNLLFWGLGRLHKLASLRRHILHSLLDRMAATPARSAVCCPCAFPRHQHSHCQPLTKLSALQVPENPRRQMPRGDESNPRSKRLEKEMHKQLLEPQEAGMLKTNLGSGIGGVSHSVRKSQSYT